MYAITGITGQIGSVIERTQGLEIPSGDYRDLTASRKTVRQLIK